MILLGCLAAASNVFPRGADMSELLSDLRSGRATAMHVVYVSPMEVRARWSVGLLGDKELTYHSAETPGSPDAQEEFTDLIRLRLGTADEGVSLDSADPLSSLGGLSILVPILYWRFIALAWLKWAVLLAFLIVLTDICMRGSLRAVSAGYWLAACVLLGSGVPAYLWSEPSSLRRESGTGVAAVAGISGWGVVVRTLGWFGGVALLGVAVLALR